MYRYEIINALIVRHGYKRYLEVGLANGECFEAVVCEHKESVDVSGTPTHLMPSDVYFATHDNRFDIIFIDGGHTFAQASRDIDNALARLNDGGCVVVHDCIPATRTQASDTYNDGAWMGGVWRAIAHLRTRPDLNVVTINDDCGCAVRHGQQEPYTLPEPLDFDALVRERADMLALVTTEEFFV